MQGKLAAMKAQAMQAGPGALEARRKEIVANHARGHHALDRYGVPRMTKPEGSEQFHEYTIAQRIELLAEAGQITPQPKQVLSIK